MNDTVVSDTTPLICWWVSARWIFSHSFTVASLFLMLCLPNIKLVHGQLIHTWQAKRKR